MKQTTIAILVTLMVVIFGLVFLFSPKKAGAQVPTCYNTHANPCVESTNQCTNKVNSQGWSWGHCPSPTPTPTRTPSPTPTVRATATPTATPHPEVWCHYHWFGCHEDLRRHCDDGWSEGRCPTPSATPVASPTPTAVPLAPVSTPDPWNCEMDHSCVPTNSAPSCGTAIAPTIKFAVAHRLGTNAIVNYWPTVVGGQVNLRYKETGASEWQHAARDLPNFGIVAIGFLKANVKYDYQLTNGYDCGQSNWSNVFQYL